MAVPKKRQSKSRRDQRRSQNSRIAVSSMSTCPKCKEPKLPHHVCPNCGYYKGRQVIVVEEV